MVVLNFNFWFFKERDIGESLLVVLFGFLVLWGFKMGRCFKGKSSVECSVYYRVFIFFFLVFGFLKFWCFGGFFLL